MTPDAPTGGSGATAAPPTSLSTDVGAALPAWAAARAVVGFTLLAAHYAFGRLHLQEDWIRHHLHQGIVGWDAERYQQIAVHWYGPLPRRELRFFPLLPLLTRA